MVTTVSGDELMAASPAPLMHYTRSMAAADHRWEIIGDYAIWTGNRRLDETQYVQMELRDGKVIAIPPEESGPILHRIPAGTPYRASGLFGFWHACDADTMWVQVEYEGKRFYSMMMGGARGRPNVNRCEWYCPHCARLLQNRTFDTKTGGFTAFLRTILEWVRDFNADETARTCADCGSCHPLGYGFDPQEDTAAEASERKSW